MPPQHQRPANMGLLFLGFHGSSDGFGCHSGDGRLWSDCRLASKEAPGGGWLAYDQQFRQQRAAGLDLKWNDLSPSITAATVLRSAHETCTLCHFPDHATEQCALFSQEPPKAPRPPARPSPYKVKPYAVPKPLNSEPCRRFNRGACPSMAETCRYSHTCSACEKPGHGAVSCPDPLSLATKKKGGSPSN